VLASSSLQESGIAKQLGTSTRPPGDVFHVEQMDGDPQSGARNPRICGAADIQNTNLAGGTFHVETFGKSNRKFSPNNLFHVKHLATELDFDTFRTFGGIVWLVSSPLQPKRWVGKTTTAVNLAACLAAAEQPTLFS